MLIPKPVSYEPAAGHYIPREDGKDVRVRMGDKTLQKVVKDLPAFAAEEAYLLTVSLRGIDIRALTQEGADRARQTLAQLRLLSEDGTLPCGTIMDWPRFAHRGFMMDLSRHFRSKDFILKQLDAMALLKMNVFHMHLTDGAGWRIQIDSYPRLTSLGAWRDGADFSEWNRRGSHYLEEGTPGAYGGYLTKDELREIVAYAAERHIEVIPEIEMPGHSSEVLRAYPEVACLGADGKPVYSSDVCPGSEETFKLFQSVLDEVIEIFPSRLIHIGGDEAGKQSWHNCPRCRARMEAEGLKNVEELQSYLIKRMEKFANDNGKTIIGWDEILEGGLAPNATVMSWRGTEGGHKAIADGHDVIFSPTQCYYLDYMQARDQYRAVGAYQPLRQTYSFEPIDENIAPQNVHHVLGVQGNLWTEFVNEQWHAETMLYPRLFAIAETGWSQPEKKDYDAFRARAMTWNKVLDYLGYCHYDLAPKEKDGN